MKIKANNKTGYSIVEMIVYISILSIICLVLMNTILSFVRSYRDVASLRMIDESGIDAMERMTRDIRSASSVDTSSSVLGMTPGVLTLVTTENGLSTTTRFYTENGVLKVDVNGAYSGPLTLGDVSVSSLSFKLLSSNVSSAVKIDMAIQAVTGTSTVRTKFYHSTIVLKGQ